MSIPAGSLLVLVVMETEIDPAMVKFVGKVTAVVELETDSLPH